MGDRSGGSTAWSGPFGVPHRAAVCSQRLFNAILQRTDLPVVTQDETLDIVLDKFSRYDVHSLAVLDESREGVVVGLITRSRLMQRYQNALRREA